MSENLKLSDIVENLKTDGTALINDNIALAKAELKPSIKHAGTGAGGFGAAGYLALNALSLLFLAGAAGFTMLFNRVVGWSMLLSVIVGLSAMAVLLLLIAAALAKFGKSHMDKIEKPVVSIAEAKATGQALVASLKRGRQTVEGSVLEAKPQTRKSVE